MKSRTAPAGVLALVAAVAASFFWFRPRERGGKKGTIVLYRDERNVCQTITTPFFKASKDGGDGEARWKIDDEFNCLGTTDFVEIVFDNPEILRDCVKKGKQKIECQLNRSTPEGTYKYSVYINDRRTEDPELQIEM